MDEIQVTYDVAGNILTIYFGDPKSESVGTDIEDGVHLMQDADGAPIGIEVLGFKTTGGKDIKVAVKTVRDGRP